MLCRTSSYANALDHQGLGRGQSCARIAAASVWRNGREGGHVSYYDGTKRGFVLGWHWRDWLSAIASWFAVGLLAVATILGPIIAVSIIQR